MATATCQTVMGTLSVAQPFKLRSAICQTVVGFVSVAGNKPWRGSVAKPKDVSWLPNATVPVLDARGNMSRPWYLFFKEIAERRLGGITAETVPQVIDKQNQTNTFVTDAQTNLAGMAAQVNAVTGVVNTQTQVSQTAGLPGADQLPIVPDYRPPGGRVN
jgi:hypothetical protein